MDRKKTVFLLGAGASAGIIPTIDTFNNSIVELIIYLRQIKEDIFVNNLSVQNDRISSILWGNFNSKMLSEIDHFITQIDNLRKRSKNYSSIDTYAKKLFVTKNPEFELTKIYIGALISCFENIGFPIHIKNRNASGIGHAFHYKFKDETETRYDSLFATIIEDQKKEVSSKYSIVSWNYDNQIELALLDYFTELTESNKINNKLPINIINKLYAPEETPLTDFSLVKINGSATIYCEKEHNNDLLTKGESFPYTIQYERPNFIDKEKNKILLIRIVLSSILAEKGYFKSNISFAWEKEKSVVKFANHLFANTGNIVVIGYSFPYFNQEIDYQIFKTAIKNNSNCNIYIQDPNFRVIKDRILSIIENPNNSEKEKINEAIPSNQFYMPYFDPNDLNTDSYSY